MKYNITPKSLILSILLVMNNFSAPIKILVEIGEIFGFTSNTMRVTTARLIREGKIESDERGLYRLGDKSTPISEFIMSWKTGENRLIPWDGTWNCCLLTPATAQARVSNKKSLDHLGFMESLPNFWIRPNNLRIGISGIRKMAQRFRVHEKSVFYTSHEFEPAIEEQWQRYLWPVEELMQSQRLLTEKLKKSQTQLKNYPSKNALMECYINGSEAVHQLITDPLLPEEIMPCRHRIQLTKIMLEYNELGKEIWMNQITGLTVDNSPSHLQLVNDEIQSKVI